MASKKLDRTIEALQKLKEAEDSADETTTVVESSSAEESLKSKGIYYIYGEITAGSLKSIHQDILLKHHQGPGVWDEPIQLIINSPGGDLDEANALMDLMANVRMDVYTTGVGSCASAAAMLLCAGTKGHRLVCPSTTIMVHRYSWGSYDKQHELVARRAIEDATHEHMVEFWREHSKYKTKKDVEKHLLKTTDNWMTASAAKNAGIVDGITARLR